MLSMFTVSLFLLLAFFSLFAIVAILSTGLAWCKGVRLGGIKRLPSLRNFQPNNSHENGSHDHSRKGGLWWSALMAIPLILLLLLGTVRVQVIHNPTNQVEAQQHAATMQRDLALQQAQIVKNGEQMLANAKMRIEQMNIHNLMDQSDAPRIALPPEPPAPAEPPKVHRVNATVTKLLDADMAKMAEVELVADTTVETAKEDALAKDRKPKDDPAPQAKPNQKKSKKRVSAESVIAQDTTEVSETAIKATNASSESQAANAAAAHSETASSSGGKRPPWVDDPPKRVGNTQREVVIVGDYQTEDECYKFTDIYLLLETHDRLMQLNGTPTIAGHPRSSLSLVDENLTADGGSLMDGGSPIVHRLNQLALAGIGIDYIRRNIAQDEYLETVQRSVGPMKKLYTLIEFTPTVDRELMARWDTYRRQERFAVIGGGAASVLGLLGIAWGLMKADTMTKGYYTKRLFLGVPAVIIGVLLLLIAINDLT
jgi:hypothetical protein